MSTPSAIAPQLPAFAAPVVPEHQDPAYRLKQRVERFSAALEDHLETDFTILNLETSETLKSTQDELGGDWLGCVALCQEVARRGKPELLADESPLVLLAIPLVQSKEPSLVAVAPFLTAPVTKPEELATATANLGLSLPATFSWAQETSIWSAKTLLSMAELVADKTAQGCMVQQLQGEVEQVTTQLLATYEEISLLYRLTQNLKISRSSSDLALMALEWLSAVVPAEGFAVLLKAESTTHPGTNNKSSLLTYGEWPVDESEFEDFMECLGREAMHEPIVLNRRITGKSSWTFPAVREVISVPLTEGGKTFGWLLAANHDEEGEFGTVEASLLGSVGAILGIHGSNIELYRKQAEFLSSVVRALTSAIDAKDPYTCGHSDRVARVSVRLAEELGCDAKTQNVIYLSGLLHDIGKIGIDDNVLRKPGKLTEAEYEHIKLHPELGYKILSDLKQLDQVLPVVLHHHESWDGTGYPYNLAGEEIPFLARIVAVADSFDAMSSDRPYRKGMPFERLETILREGAGTQWDAKVIDAFMNLKDEIQEIARKEREAITLDMQQWA